MRIEPSKTRITMDPGDTIKINVGISYKCDITILSDGKLRVYYGDGKCLEI
jgi:hypothetical protein